MLPQRKASRRADLAPGQVSFRSGRPDERRRLLAHQGSYHVDERQSHGLLMTVIEGSTVDSFAAQQWLEAAADMYCMSDRANEN